MKKIILFFWIIVFVGCTTKTQKSSDKTFKENINQNGVFTAICGNKIDTLEALKYDYNNQSYYFDSYEYLMVFKKNPEKFISKDLSPNENNQQMSNKFVGLVALSYLIVLMTSIIFIGHLKRD